MREKLIELIQKSVRCARNWAEVIADHLLANGVIVPPCKVGDDIYYINEYGKVCCSEKDVQGIIYLGGSDFEIMDMDENIDKIGTRYCFLSREEAEKALERMENYE